jgi:hypothetical protein
MKPRSDTHVLCKYRFRDLSEAWFLGIDLFVLWCVLLSQYACYAWKRLILERATLRGLDASGKCIPVVNALNGYSVMADMPGANTATVGKDLYEKLPDWVERINSHESSSKVWQKTLICRRRTSSRPPSPFRGRFPCEIPLRRPKRCDSNSDGPAGRKPLTASKKRQCPENDATREQTRADIMRRRKMAGPLGTRGVVPDCRSLMAFLSSAAHKQWRSTGDALQILRRMVREWKSSASGLYNSLGKNEREFDVGLPAPVPFHSPLIHLLSIGFLSDHASTLPICCDAEGDNRLRRVFQCAKCIVQECPALLFHTSHTTSCSPLHVALRNYKQHGALLRLLIESDRDGWQLQHRNRSGDLPLHVACSVGVPMQTLKLMLNRTLALTDRPRKSGPGDRAHPLVWSTNLSGYTPIDLEWIRHVGSEQRLGSSRLVSLDYESSEQFDDSMLELAADEVKNGRRFFNDVTLEEGSDLTRAEHSFGLVLRRVFLFVQAACENAVVIVEPLVCQASSLSRCDAPVIPLPILELIFWYSPGSVVSPGNLCYLSLHRAVKIGNTPGGKYHVPRRLEKAITDWKRWVLHLISREPRLCSMTDQTGHYPLHCALGSTETCFSGGHVEARDSVVNELIERFPGVLDIPDPTSKLVPFLQAATCSAVSLDSVYSILLQSPGTIAHYRF